MNCSSKHDLPTPDERKGILSQQILGREINSDNEKNRWCGYQCLRMKKKLREILAGALAPFYYTQSRVFGDQSSDFDLIDSKMFWESCRSLKNLISKFATIKNRAY